MVDCERHCRAELAGAIELVDANDGSGSRKRSLKRGIKAQRQSRFAEFLFLASIALSDIFHIVPLLLIKLNVRRDVKPDLVEMRGSLR